jgi:hypothetical protein
MLIRVVCSHARDIIYIYIYIYIYIICIYRVRLGTTITSHTQVAAGDAGAEGRAQGALLCGALAGRVDAVRERYWRCRELGFGAGQA